MNQNPAFKNGLYFGLFSVVFTMALYFIDKRLLFNPFLPSIVLFIAGIVFMVLAAREEKEQDADGLLAYGDAVRVTFIVLAIGAVILGIFNYLLFNFIDTGLMQIMQEETKAMVESIISITGGGDEAQEEANKALENQTFSYGFGIVLVDIVGSLIWGIIKALIVSIFVKSTT
jgi:hypothetical protein